MLPLPRTEESPVSGALPHRPVLLQEIVRFLSFSHPEPVVVDATLGAGGHAEALLEQLEPDGRLVGIDRDPLALGLARDRLERFGPRFVGLRGDHRELVAMLHETGVFAVDGILVDLGVSSMQLDQPDRGFSFRHDGPLDMRMDPDALRNAADVVADADEVELRRILSQYGEERRAGAIARAIVDERRKQPLTRTAQLAELVERVLGPGARRYRIHPATRTFQALRIAVNGEVEGLRKLVADAVSVLRRGGRLAVISYHSLEDREIKHGMRSLAHRCTCPPRMPVCGCGRENLVRLLTRKPVRPEDTEIESNPRSRSARLRVAERI
jgi:16S rRNA (cytosine1402-N4)-methyltransferase